MRHVKFLLVLSAVAGACVVQHYEHERTRRRLDELAAAVAAKDEGLALPSPTPPGEVPRELSKGVIVPPRYVVEPPDVLLIEAVVRDHQANRDFGLPGQPVAGAYVVRPDGTVYLGQWGNVAVAGLTLEQAAAEVQKRLPEAAAWKTHAPVGVPVVAVKLHAGNSKRYYVTVREGVNEQTFAVPLTGDETVFDALANVPGAAALAATGSVAVQRKPSAGGVQTLPVDWHAITARGVTATNYQILNSDRVVVTAAR